MEIDNLVRENIKRLKPYTSARDQFEKGILLDANENGLGSVVESELELNRYPDPKHKEIKIHLSKITGAKSENLFIGVGSDEIIDLMIRIFCEPTVDNLLILEPTYGMYKVSADINNVHAISANLSSDFQIDFAEIDSKIKSNTKLIFLCSPNNPTGNLLRVDDIRKLCQYQKSIIVVDEAYIDFTPEGSVLELIGEHTNLVVMRTLSKAWGLAGIRAGYCAADPLIINYLYKVKAPYNLNKLTGRAIISALNNKEQMEKFRFIIVEERKRFVNAISNLPGVIKIFPSDANFLLVKFSDANTVFNKLIEKNIIIRNRSNMLGLENCLRITIGNKSENDQLINALKEIL
ncbi:MAG: histidinol-phosphate transaminase [Melioribacteraceae bacterium]|nr:histidinol-phosphate transaminase [Melioribacteraceae bacterium]